MKILLHDYAGYAFHVQLGRHLARRGHQLCYLYAGSNPAPNGGKYSHARRTLDKPLCSICSCYPRTNLGYSVHR